MSTWLSEIERAGTRPADEIAFESPIPTQIVSNGEYNPPRQTERQRRVEAVLRAKADVMARRLGVERRSFLRSSAGMAAAFLAMNQVYGPVFRVGAAEAADPDVCAARSKGLEHQFIFDVQTHFLHDDYAFKPMLFTRRAAHSWCRDVPVSNNFSLYQFENYLQEVFLDSDTDIALLSGAPSETPGQEALSNAAMAKARDLINRHAGSKRLYSHAMVQPSRSSSQWLDEVDEAIEVHKPDSWKGYTVGDPLTFTPTAPWRLDDEKLVYPFYEKAMKAGIRTICVHKGLVPHEVSIRQPEAWEAASVVDVGKAAKDWPGLTFVIYHAGLHAGVMETEDAAARFEKTGYIPWVSDLAKIPAQYGVSNVYAEIGTSFGSTVVTYPRLAAALVGTLIKGMGVDHVLWGTDSVFYGSPQWQIEALRRLEIPEDLQATQGFAPLGAEPDSPVKNAIFGLNAARLYGLEDVAKQRPFDTDTAAAIRAEYRAGGGMRSNLRYGFVHRA
jgi:predicted TIM-barrel fold metal-dependent hydrolase